MIRTSRGLSRYTSGEVDALLGAPAAWLGQARPLVYCHGSGDNADTPHNKAGQGPLIRALAEEYAVGVAHLGGETFGNDTGITRVGEHAAYLSSAWGAEGPVVLVAQSAGVLDAMGYARAHPENVAAIACTIPALDIADVYAATTGGPVPALIDAAYGGTYSDVTHGPTHSPIQYADELDGIPIALWAADNDTAARPGPVNAFKAARPATEVTWVGNLEHTENAVLAASEGLLAWLRGL